MLDGIPGIGPATRAVVQELEQTGTSTLLERLRADTPVGLLEVMRIPRKAWLESSDLWSWPVDR